MRKIMSKAVIAGTLILISSLACYASDAGTTAANFLKIGVGARATAMGGAFTAIVDDGTALYWNPAGLARIEDLGISAMYNMHFQEVTQGYLSGAFPFLGGTVGLGVNYIDMGQIEGRDEEGNPTDLFGASDTHISLGYARKLSSRLMLGVSAGILQEIIAEDTKNALLANGGLLFMPSSSLSLGLAVQNIGSSLGEDPLPFTWRTGVAYSWNSLTIGADAVKATDNEMQLCAGLEWWIGSMIALRGGYTTGQDTGSGISCGLGLNIRTIDLDYAYVPYGELGNTHKVSISITL